MSKPTPKTVPLSDARVLDVLGTLNIIRIAGKDSGERVLFIEVEFPPGVGIPQHVHTREDEVFHVLSGLVEFSLAGRPQVVGPNTTVYGPRDVPHAYRATTAGPARMLVSVVPAGLELMFEELAVLPKEKPDLEEVAQIVARYGISFV